MLRIIDEKWDRWLDGVIEDNLPQVLIGTAICLVFVIGAALYMFVGWAATRALEGQLYLRDLEIKTLRQQQEANQRDINRLIAEEFYIKQEMRRLQR